MEPKYKYSETSKKKLETCNSDLQKLFEAVLETGIFDLTIIEGKRSKERQKELVKQGKSKTMNSKHLTGNAVDVGIFKNGGIDWKDKSAYYVLAGVVYVKAKELGVYDKLRWGGNWDRDKDLNDQDFNDLVHYEILD